MVMRELCQLAGVWDLTSVPAGGCMAEEKIDGFRALHFRDWRGRPGLFTRNGHQIEGVSHILNKLDIMEQLAGERLMFDGEFQVEGTLAATKRWCERGWKIGGDAGTMHLFDVIPEADWRQGGCDMPLYERKKRLGELIKAAEAVPHAWMWREGTHGREPDGPAVTMIEDEWAVDAGEALALARRVWAVHGEGIMLKEATAPYRRTRSDAWQKVKQTVILQPHD